MVGGRVLHRRLARSLALGMLGLSDDSPGLKSETGAKYGGYLGQIS